MLLRSCIFFIAVSAFAQVKPNLTPETRGDIFMARKMYREAIDTFREGSPKDPVLLNKIGIAYHQLMQLDNARKSYEQAVKLRSDYAEAINNLGTIYYARKSYRRAIGYYKRALKITPQSASIHSNLGTAYWARKQYPQAMESLRQMLQDILGHLADHCVGRVKDIAQIVLHYLAE